MSGLSGIVIKQLRPALVILVALTVITGVIYPVVVTAIAQAAFREQANGSLVTGPSGAPVGSRLIGQQFDAPGYFWGRLSATGGIAYNANGPSSGSNYGPLNDSLLAAVQARIDALKAVDKAAGLPENLAPIPVDLVTASGSGLDPHISPAAAAYQVARVAKVRGMTVDEVQTLVDKYTEGRALGFLGEPTVNVLLLNLALDEAKPIQ